MAEPNELTVEEALEELREMFPNVPHRIDIRDVCKRLDVDIYIDGVRRGEATNQANCGVAIAMAQVRAWGSNG